MQVEWEIRRLQKRFLHFDSGFVVVVELEDNVGEAFEIRIDRAIEGELDVARVKAALLRIVIADFDAIEVARRRSGERKHSVERNVHVILAAANRDRRREG